MSHPWSHLLWQLLIAQTYFITPMGGFGLSFHKPIFMIILLLLCVLWNMAEVMSYSAEPFAQHCALDVYLQWGV